MYFCTQNWLNTRIFIYIYKYISQAYQSISRESDPCLVVIKLCDNCNVLALAQGPLLFFIFVFMVFNNFIHLWNRKLFQKESNDFESNGFFFCRNEKNNEFFIEIGNGLIERVSFIIKGPMNGIDSFLKETSTTLITHTVFWNLGLDLRLTVHRDRRAIKLNLSLFRPKKEKSCYILSFPEKH